jgi:hypothetical protein
MFGNFQHAGAGARPCSSAVVERKASWLVCRAVVVFLAVSCPLTAAAETRTVRRGANLQTVLNSAMPGDVIELEGGAEFVGNFVLPVKDGDAPIVVRSAAAGEPPDGVRLAPQSARQLARIRSASNVPALRTAAGAHHWELRYLEFAANQNGYGDIIQIGDGSSAQNTLARVPHHLALIHLYVHGDPLVGQKRCIALNAAHVTIRDSYVADCKGVGNDTQAIGGWNGPGPYQIENNYLEAAGENVLFGGADPAIPNLVPDGIVVRGNHFSRPMAWRDPIIPTPQGVVGAAEAGGGLPAGAYAYRIVARRHVGQGTTGRSTASAEVTVTVADGGAVRLAWQAVADASEYRVYGRTISNETIYWTVTGTTFLDTGSAGAAGAVPTGAGTVWSVKNIFELKNARNVVIERNILENHWKESQAGYAIVFTPRNSDETCSWCVVEGVRFESNVVRHVAAGINLLGYDSPEPTQQTNGIIIRNNLFYDVSTRYGGNAWFMLIGDEPRDILIDHNTVSHDGASLLFLYGGSATSPRKVLRATITNNAARHGAYGVNGNYFSYGNGIIENYLPAAIVTSNFLPGGSASRYPGGNRFSGSFDAQFVAAATDDFRLREDSVLRGTASDGGDVGADIGTVLAYTSAVVAGGVRVQSPSNFRIVTQ